MRIRTLAASMNRAKAGNGNVPILLTQSAPKFVTELTNHSLTKRRDEIRHAEFSGRAVMWQSSLTTVQKKNLTSKFYAEGWIEEGYDPEKAMQEWLSWDFELFAQRALQVFPVERTLGNSGRGSLEQLSKAIPFKFDLSKGYGTHLDVYWDQQEKLLEEHKDEHNASATVATVILNTFKEGSRDSKNVLQEVLMRGGQPRNLMEVRNRFSVHQREMQWAQGKLGHFAMPLVREMAKAPAGGYGQNGGISSNYREQTKKPQKRDRQQDNESGPTTNKPADRPNG